MDHQLARIQELEKSVRRWRLVSFGLAVMLLSLVAIATTFVALLIMGMGDRVQAEILKGEERAARLIAEEALREAQETTEKERQARMRAEQALRELEAARK
jgi:hypothetical protein